MLDFIFVFGIACAIAAVCVACGHVGPIPRWLERFGERLAGCTGHYVRGSLQHDGDTCPIHEAHEEAH